MIFKSKFLTHASLLTSASGLTTDFGPWAWC